MGDGDVSSLYNDQLNKSKETTVKNMWENFPSKLDAFSMEDFVKYFDASETFSDVEKMGFIDFSTRIFTPEFYDWLEGDSRKKTCLEIGFGAGRLMNPASKYFKNVIGIDIHHDFYKTKKVLEKLNCTNYSLFHRDEIEKIEDNSIDFVYSFITFQHFDKWSEVDFYLQHIERVLKKTGCGILYFGINDRDQSDYLEVGDKSFDKHMVGGIEARKIQPGGYTLVVKPEFAMTKMNEYFNVLETMRGSKRPWLLTKSSQFYIKFISKKHPLQMTKIKENKNEDIF